MSTPVRAQTARLAAVSLALYALSGGAPTNGDFCEGLDSHGRLEECDRTFDGQNQTNCVLRGYCPVEQPEFGLGYQECRQQDWPPVSPLYTPAAVCDFLPGEWEDCNGNCVPRGRKCTCRKEDCAAQTSSVTGCAAILGPEFESCRGDCVPRGDCGSCAVLGPGLENCRGVCVPFGDCLQDGVQDGGIACTICESCLLEIELTLELEYEDVVCGSGYGPMCGRNFTAALTADLSRITKVSVGRFIVTDIQPGSVVVTVQILDDPERSAVTPVEALVAMQHALALSNTNDVNHAMCEGVVLGVEATCFGTATDANIYPQCSVAMAAAVYNHREDCPDGCDYRGTEAMCEDVQVCIYTEQVANQDKTIKTPESCISQTFHSRQTIAGGAVLAMAVTADPPEDVPAVPCPAHSRGAGDGEACTCRNGYLGFPVWNPDIESYYSRRPIMYSICDEIVNCATPNNWAGMFDVTSGCASTPSGGTCAVYCAPGSKGRSTVFDCPANNVDPYFLSFGSYPNDCQGAPMAADPSEIAQLMFISEALGDPLALSTWVTGGDPCINYWPGVGCDYLSGGITRLSLRRQKLTGIIPNTIGRGLRNLEILELDNNDLSGAIPFELGFFMRELEKFDVSTNQLSGTLHPYLNKWKNLRKFDLRSNQLSGTIPGGFSTMTVLQRIYFRDNQFEGDLGPFVDNEADPSEWRADGAGSGMLTHVDVSRNKLTGMDHMWDNHTGLIELNLADNEITGTIPVSLSRCLQLQKLDLQNNLLSGPIPPEFMMMRSLVDLRLSNNLLNGTLPEFYHPFSNLKFLDLGGNRDISGTIPPQMGTLTVLKRLHLHDLALSGTVPPELTGLTELKRLYIRENAITGTLPVGLGLRAGEAGGCTPPYTKAELPDCQSGDYLMGWIDCSVRGASVCAEVDGCQGEPCFKSADGMDIVQCVDVPAPGAGFVCGPCPDGYEGDGFECYDIDDCVVHHQYTGVAIPNTNPCDVFDPSENIPVGGNPTRKLVNGICTDTGPNTYICDCAPDAQICADVTLNGQSARCFLAGDCLYTAFVQAVEYVAPVVGVDESCDAFQFNDGPAIDTTTGCSSAGIHGVHEECNSNNPINVLQQQACNNVIPTTALACVDPGTVCASAVGACPAGCGSTTTIAPQVLTAAAAGVITTADPYSAGFAYGDSVFVSSANDAGCVMVGVYTITALDSMTITVTPTSTSPMDGFNALQSGITVGDCQVERRACTGTATCALGPTYNRADMVTCIGTMNADADLDGFNDDCAAVFGASAGAAADCAAECEYTAGLLAGSCDTANGCAYTRAGSYGNSYATACANQAAYCVHTPGSTPQDCETFDCGGLCTGLAYGGVPRCVSTEYVHEVVEVLQIIGVEEECVARNIPAGQVQPGYRFTGAGIAGDQAGVCEEVRPCDLIELNDCDALSLCVHLGPGIHQCDCQPPGAYEGDGTVGNCRDNDACVPNPCFDGPHPFNDDVACNDIVAECKHDDDQQIAAIMADHNIQNVVTCARVMQLAADAMAGNNPHPLQCSDTFFRVAPLSQICPVSCGVCSIAEANLIGGQQGYICDPCPSGYAGNGETCFDINDCIDAQGYNPCDVRNPADPTGPVLVSGSCTDQGPNLYSCLYATGR